MGLHDRTFDIAASAPTMEKATLLHAGHAVRQFLVYLKANPIEDMTLVDIDALPLPKTTLVNAFRLLIASEARLEQRGQLRKVGLLLAQFQELGRAVEPADSADPLTSFIDTLAVEPVSNDRFWLAAYREQDDLTRLFDMSARMAERGDGVADSEADDERPELTPPN